MAMSAAQVQAELQRKKNLGIAPTNSANMGQYNKLSPVKPPSANQVTTSPLQPKPLGGMPAMAGAGAAAQLMPKPTTPVAAPTSTPGTQPPAQFTYNPETDPAYQARKRQIEAGVQTGTNNALVSLGSRGIGNSSSAVTAAAQLQQKGLMELQDTVIPQLEGQAYQRYMDDRNYDYQQGRDKVNDEQQQWNNRFNYGSTIGTFSNGQKSLAAKGQAFDQDMATKQFNAGEEQRDVDNQFRGDQFDRAKYESDRNYRQQVQQQSIDNGQWQQQFNQDVEKFGFQQASELWSQAFQMNQANQDNAAKLSQADRDAANQATNNIAKSGLVTITTDDDDNQTMSVPNPDALNKYIISLNLSDDATDSLMYQYGLDSYVKK